MYLVEHNLTDDPFPSYNWLIYDVTDLYVKATSIPSQNKYLVQYWGECDNRTRFETYDFSEVEINYGESDYTNDELGERYELYVNNSLRLDRKLEYLYGINSQLLTDIEVL